MSEELENPESSEQGEEDKLGLSREAFLARKNRNLTTAVTLADGAVVKCRKLSQAEVEYIRKNYANETKALEGLRYVVLKCLLDDTGNRVFRDNEIGLVQSAVDFDDVKTIATAVTKFSGLDTDAKNA